MNIKHSKTILYCVLTMGAVGVAILAHNKITIYTEKQNQIKLTHIREANDEWLRKYASSSHYNIETNQNYANKLQAFPESLISLSKEIPELEHAMQSVIKEIKAYDYIYELNKKYLPVNSATFEQSEIFFRPGSTYIMIPLKQAGTVYISTTKENNIKEVFIGSEYFITAYKEDDVSANKVKTYISNHRKILGEPKYTYADDLYGASSSSIVDFYPELGVGFSIEHIIVFKPNIDLSEEELSTTGRIYVRSTLGTQGRIAP